jgi:hypothetical protein
MRNYCILYLKKTALILFIVVPFMVCGQVSLNENSESLAYFLFKYPSVCRATMVSDGKHSVKIKASNWIKNNQKHNKKIRIRTYQNKRGSDMMKYMGLEREQEYIFILGTKFRLIHPTPLREVEHRFIITDDSIFIPSSMLKNLTGLERLEINEAMTNDDPILKTGFRISVNDFIALTNEINAHFILHRDNRNKKYSCIEKSRKPISSKDTLTLALLDELMELWEENPCP